MTSTNENPFAGLNLSHEDDQRVWALIHAQVDVVQKMRRLVLALALVVVGACFVNKFAQMTPAPGPDVELAGRMLMKWAAGIAAGMSILGLALYQIMLHKLQRAAMTLPIARDKLKCISDQTHWALVRVMFGAYGYRLIRWVLASLGANGKSHE